MEDENFESFLECDERELNIAYPKEYYRVVNCGWGDGDCYGPYTAWEALHEYCIHRPLHLEWPLDDPMKEFSRLLNQRDRTDYISDYFVHI